MKEYKWATLGTGVIANQLAQALEARGTKLYAVANRTHEKGVAFAEKYGIEKVYDNMEDVFDDPEVDIIYISTPHNTHAKYLRKALAAKKHVLCEKSITLNSDELEEAIALAKKNNVVLAEAMTIFHMPLYQTLAEKAKELGELRLVTVNFGSYKEYNLNNRFFSRNLAGGSMLDIGVYALAFTRWFLSSNPEEITSQVVMTETGVDEKASILLKNEENEMASIMLSLHSKQPKRGMVSFDKGYIEVMEFPRSMKATITYTDDGHTEEIVSGDTLKALQYETMDMEKAIEGNPQVMHLDLSRDVMEIMTKIRRSWGMTYPEEE